MHTIVGTCRIACGVAVNLCLLCLLILLFVAAQVEYLLRYNDSSIYSIPIGITTMSNTALRIALKKAGKSYSGRMNPIMANSKPFESLKVPWVYDSNVFTSVLLLGLTFALLPNGFSIEVVQVRQVFNIYSSLY